MPNSPAVKFMVHIKVYWRSSNDFASGMPSSISFRAINQSDNDYNMVTTHGLDLFASNNSMLARRINPVSI